MIKRTKGIFSLTLSVILFISWVNPVFADFTAQDIESIKRGTVFYNPDFRSEYCSVGTSTEFPYELPATQGKTGKEEDMDETGKISSGGTVTFSKFASLGQEYRDYYITMRWNYADWNWNGSAENIDQQQFSWFADQPRLIQVTNERTGKSIIAAALEAGPAPWAGVDSGPNNDPKQGWVNPQNGTPDTYTGRVSGFTATGLEALGAEQGTPTGGDVLTYQWAADQNATPGPIETADSCSAGSAGENGWSIEGQDAMTLFYQYKDPWADQSYGVGTIGACGCGPTSLAMAIQSLTGIGTDPKKMADYFVSIGGQVSDCSSYWIWSSAADKFKSDYGVTVKTIATTEDAMMAALKRGSFVIMSQGRGIFTNGGHILLLRGFTNTGNFLVADPNSESYTERAEGFEPNVVIGDGTADPLGRAGTKGYLRGAWEISL